MIASPGHGVYVVRIWLEPTEDGAGSWRASLTDVATHERHAFSSPQALGAFVQALGQELLPWEVESEET